MVLGFLRIWKGGGAVGRIYWFYQFIVADTISGVCEGFKPLDVVYWRQVAFFQVRAAAWLNKAQSSVSSCE
jgi:hypothetical protein